MKKKTIATIAPPPVLTLEQQSELDSLVAQGHALRGVQIFIAGLGGYLAIFEGRGWPAFLIGLALAAWMQTQLPHAPPWAQQLDAERRKKKQPTN